MHQVQLEALQYILGANSDLYTMLVKQAGASSTPKINELLLLRRFRDFTYVAAKNVLDEEIEQQAMAHLMKKNIQTEKEAWVSRIPPDPVDQDSLTRFIHACILNRDFCAISAYVEENMKKQFGSLLTAGNSMQGSGEAGAVGFKTPQNPAHAWQNTTPCSVEEKLQIVHKMAECILSNLVSFVNDPKATAWDHSNSSYMASIWAHYIVQLNAEAHLVFCGEITKHRNDEKYTAAVFCNMCKKNGKHYTPDHVQRWYHAQDEHNPDDTQLICDIYLFKSSSQASCYTYVMPTLCDKNKKVTIGKLRQIMNFCVTLVNLVDRDILKSIMPIDNVELCSICSIVSDLWSKSSEEQDWGIAQRMQEIPNCLAIRNACKELQKCLRMYVFLFHIGGEKNTGLLLQHLVDKNVFSVDDSIWKTFQSWVVNGCNNPQSREISAGIIQWGWADFVEFFNKSQDLDFVVSDPVMQEGEDSAAFMGSLLCGDECMYDLLQEESVWPQRDSPPTLPIFDSDSDSDLFI